jgi:hypothetical protein
MIQSRDRTWGADRRPKITAPACHRPGAAMGGWMRFVPTASARTAGCRELGWPLDALDADGCSVPAADGRATAAGGTR